MLGISLLFLSDTIQIIGLLCLIPIAFLNLLVLEFTSRESVDPVKIGIISALSALAISFSFSPDAIVEITYPNGELSLDWNGLFFVGMVLVVLFYCVAVLYWGSRIYRGSPHNLKKYSSLFLLACLIVGIGIPAVQVSGVENIIPGLDAVALAIGAIIFAFVFVKRPQLAYILPFKVLRLTIIDTASGIPLFTHTWGKMGDIVDETLFSGMVHGISSILNEALHRGNIRVIELDEATLILNRSPDFNAACILVTTKATPSLRAALRAFAEDFYAQFSPYLSTPNNVGPFAGASELVKKHFAFVPVYD
jgi:hypothetical protein